MMSRLPYPEAGMNEESVFSSLNIRKMMGHLPVPIFERFAALGEALVREGALSPALREVAIVKAAHLMGVEYELHHHIPLAKVTGVSDEALLALRDDTGTAGLSAEEAAVARFVSEIVARPRPSDEALSGVRAVLSIPMIFEIIALVGYYMTLGRMIETSGIEPESFSLSADTMRLQ